MRRIVCDNLIIRSKGIVELPYLIGLTTDSKKDKISDWSKFKTFATDKIIVSQKLKFVMRRV